jgi:hypothetical protein
VIVQASSVKEQGIREQITNGHGRRDIGTAGSRLSAVAGILPCSVPFLSIVDCYSFQVASVASLRIFEETIRKFAKSTKGSKCLRARRNQTITAKNDLQKLRS